MRGKEQDQRHRRLHPGITPACAGKSTKSRNAIRSRWDHPRMCGEKLTATPRRTEPQWITPAYAGKSSAFRNKRALGWDHPRVCGEKNCAVSIDTSIAGSPPRMRGKAQIRLLSIWQKRITPAYAGKSRSWSAHRQQQRRRHRQQPLDHPRVCGEKTKKIP